MKELAARGDIYKEDNSIPVAEVQHEPFHDAAINGDSVKELISQGQREAAKLGAITPD